MASVPDQVMIGRLSGNSAISRVFLRPKKIRLNTKLTKIDLSWGGHHVCHVYVPKAVLDTDAPMGALVMEQ